MKDYLEVYADNAATTRVSKTAVDAMLPLLHEEYGNPSSLYTKGQIAAEKLAEARMKVGELLGAADPMREITFTSGGSEADNQAIVSAAMLGMKQGKKHLISTKFEHHAVLHTLDALEKRGFEITLLDVHENGVVTVEDLRAALREDTALVTIMMVNNEIGTLQPIKELAAICKEKNVLFHTDAVQSTGHMHIDVQDLGVDMLSFSGHKFNAPKGVGGFYARKGIKLSNIIEGGAQERGKRGGTENMAGIVAMAAALEEAVSMIDSETERHVKMRDRLIESISKIPHSKLNGDRMQRNASTVNFCFEGIEGESLLLMLDSKGISASSGSACTSGSLDPSHVLLSLGLPHEVAHGSLRLSLGRYNTEEDIDHIIYWVPKVVEKLREMSPLWEDLEKGKTPHLI